MNADGSGQRRLTSEPAIELGPVSSPDGTKIAYTHLAPPAPRDVFVMEADGREQQNIKNHPALDIQPDWQPLASEDRERGRDDDGDDRRGFR